MDINENNFLFIAYDFPPLNSGGSFRPARFSSELKSLYGLNPIIITVDHEEISNGKIDIELGNSVPKEIAVIRTDIKPVSYISKLIDTGYFFYKDSILFRWKKNLLSKIKYAIVEYNPKFIIVTVPPFSLLTFIRKIGFKFKIPIIYDFRDPNSFWVSSPYPTKLHYNYHKIIEKKCIKSCSKCLVTTNEAKEYYNKYFPEISRNKFSVVFNSFDEEQISGFDYSLNPKEIIIGYFGSFYYNKNSDELMKNPWWVKKPYQYFQYIPFMQDWFYRTPYYFFKALSVLFENRPEYKTVIKIYFAGNKPYWFDEMVRSFSMSDNVKHFGFISKSKINDLQQICNAFLITSAKVDKGKDFFIAGKTFEYFRFRKPIIAFVAEGSQKWIIEKSGLGVICEPDDPEKSAEKLDFFFKNKYNFKPDFDFINKFSTKNQVKYLNEILQSLVK